MLRFLFDLDGTLTTEESVIAVVRTFGLDQSIADATRAACISGEDYRSNFNRRVKALSSLPVGEVARVVAKLRLRRAIAEFINGHSECCAIVSNNLDCWCLPLAAKFECDHYFSRAEINGDTLVGIAGFTDKHAVVEKYQKQGYRTVYIGDGANDAEAMRAADISVAVGFSEYPCEALSEIADYTARSEAELVTFLLSIINEQA